tara:strand:+ start:226678 stop:227052 length:375 start_codon:yes stop_codon:yes gene_type:complete
MGATWRCVLKKLALALLLMQNAISYEFTKKFTIENASLNGSQLLLEITFPQGFSSARFELIPFNGCQESFPVQCSATLVRLDHQYLGERIGHKKLSFNTHKIFNMNAPMVLTIFGPNGEFTLRD